MVYTSGDISGLEWSRSAWMAAEPVYRKILELPFIRELAAGTLPREKFMFYIRQDAMYLKEYGRAMSAAASRFQDPDAMALFLRFATDNLESEKALHDTFLQEPVRDAFPSPVCLLCSSHLWRQVSGEPVEVAVASVLPCFVVYEMVGRHIYETASPEANPYMEWIKVYGGDGFGDSTEKLSALCDRLAEKAAPEVRAGMTGAFVTGVRLEWMFWDSMYRMSRWPI